MQRSFVTIFALLFFIFGFFGTAPAAAQTLTEDLPALVEIPGVTGYEQPLAGELRVRLKNLSPRTDNLGNVYVTLGSGSPWRLIVAPMDEPGYMSSNSASRSATPSRFPRNIGGWLARARTAGASTIAWAAPRWWPRCGPWGQTCRAETSPSSGPRRKKSACSVRWRW